MYIEYVWMLIFGAGQRGSDNRGWTVFSKNVWCVYNVLDHREQHHSYTIFWKLVFARTRYSSMHFLETVTASDFEQSATRSLLNTLSHSAIKWKTIFYAKLPLSLYLLTIVNSLTMPYKLARWICTSGPSCKTTIHTVTCLKNLIY